MNIESTKAFIDKLATDKDFANKFKAEATVDSLVSLMHSEGFECTGHSSAYRWNALMYWKH